MLKNIVKISFDRILHYHKCGKKIKEQHNALYITNGLVSTHVTGYSFEEFELIVRNPDEFEDVLRESLFKEEFASIVDSINKYGGYMFYDEVIGINNDN